MAIVEVKVPQLSESVAEATMLQWKKKVGDVVAADEILIEIETDKVVLEVPAPSAGVLSEILVADGGTVAAEHLIARIDMAGDRAAAAEHFVIWVGGYHQHAIQFRYHRHHQSIRFSSTA